MSNCNDYIDRDDPFVFVKELQKMFNDAKPKDKARAIAEEFLEWWEKDITHQYEIFKSHGGSHEHSSCILIMRMQVNKLKRILKSHGIEVE